MVTRNFYYANAEFWNAGTNVCHKQPEGSLKASQDEAGLTTSYAYYPNGALGQVKSPDGRITRYTLDYNMGNVTGIPSDWGTARAFDRHGLRCQMPTATRSARPPAPPTQPRARPWRCKPQPSLTARTGPCW